MSPTVPFSPSTVKEHRARVAEALEVLYDVEAVELGSQQRPGAVPENIFDFADGYRLILSREKDSTGLEVLHLSASVDATFQKRGMFKNRMEFQERVISKAKTLLKPRKAKWHFVGFSKGKGIPHWYAQV